MKYIWLGIKDYCRDCWHDWLSKRLHKSQGERLYTYDHKEDEICWVFPWKEGNLWHYIQQRKAAKLLEEIKTLQKELKRKDVK